MEQKQITLLYKDDLDRTDKQRVDLAKNWLTWGCD